MVTVRCAGPPGTPAPDVTPHEVLPTVSSRSYRGRHYAGRHRVSGSRVRLPRAFGAGFVLPTTAAAALVVTATGASVAETSQPVQPLAFTMAQQDIARTQVFQHIAKFPMFQLAAGAMEDEQAGFVALRSGKLRNQLRRQVKMELGGSHAERVVAAAGLPISDFASLMAASLKLFMTDFNGLWVACAMPQFIVGG